VTILVQSFLNSATKLVTTATTATTVIQLKNLVSRLEGISTSTMQFYIVNPSTTATVLISGTLGSYGITTATTIYSSNTISTLATKELRQKTKLDLAAIKRAEDGNLRSTYDLTQLPTQYNNNTVVNNPNIGGLVVGRPWIATVNTFTFYEAFGTTVALSTTQYVSGNKIYAYSSTYDVPGGVELPARVVVNDIEVLLRGVSPPLPYGRGHNMVVLDTYGDVVTPAAQYDTYFIPGDLTALASALNAVASGNIVVLVVYDASALNAAVRTAINTGYGSTNSTTWTADRKSHIFIGVKI
jgi:uncharacterized protein (DUF1697 family)